MDARRLADVRGGVADGYRSLGSGYVIAPRLVLTARHVVVREEASLAWPRIIVRVGHPRPGSRVEHSATVAWVHPEQDVAVLLLDEPVPVSGPVRWGEPVGRKPLPYEAIGFPEAAVKADGRRQPEHLRGSLPVLTGGNGPGKNYALDQDVTPAESEDGEQAWAGASGSAVFCYDHLVGVAIHDDDAFANRRLHACPAHIFVTHPKFIELMERYAEVPVLSTVSADEPPDAQAEYALDLLLRLSEGAVSDANIVARRPDEQLLTLSGGMYVSRHVEADILRRLDEGKVTLVVGEAGHGKTTLLWGLHHQLNVEGRQPVLVRASDLLAGLRREGQSTAGISPPQLHAALPELAQSEKRPVLLLDTLDLLLHSDDTRNVVIELLTSLVRLRIPTVVTCRPVEATLLRTTGVEDQLPNRRVNLLSYDDEECRAAVHAYSRHFYAGVRTFTADEVANSVLNAASRGRALREVCANPFALRLLFEVYAPDKPDEDVDTPRLYDEYWHKRIRADQRAWRRPEEGQDVDLSGFAESTARLLLALGRLDITRPELEARLRDMETSGPVGASAAIDLLRTRGVFTLRRQVNRLWFFHQTFFEHAAARGVLSCGAEAVQELLERVKQDPGDLFFGEVASEVLLMADRWSASGSDSVTGLLGPWMASHRPALVSLALPVYAKLKHPDAELVALGRATLETAEPNDVRRFLTMLPSVVHPDSVRPFGDLAVIWNRRDSQGLALRRPLLEALIRLAATNATEAWRFLQDHACLDWLRERPVDNRGYNEYPYTAVLSAVAAAAPETVLDEALAFAARLAEAGNGGGLTDLTLGIIGWCHTPRLARRAAKGVLTALERLNPKMTSLDLERAYARLFLVTRPKCADAAPAVAEAFEADQNRGASPLSRRAVLRGWAAAVMQADEAHVSDFLSACLSTRKPHQQVAVCNAVLTEALIGQPERFTRTPLAAPVWGADENVTVSPLTAQVVIQCKEALATLPCSHKDPDGAKTTPWLMRRALQDADLPDTVLRDLLPVVPEEAAERFWLTSDACCVFLVDAAAGAHPQAEHMLQKFLTDPDARRRVTELTSGKDSVTRIGGDLQRKVTTHPHLIDDLLPYADSTNQPHLVQQAVTKVQNADRSTAQAWFTLAQWSSLVDYRKRLVKHALPYIRRQGYMLWSALLEVGVDVHPQATEITDALKAAAAQDLREALLGLTEDTVRARRWGPESVPLVHQALQPIIDEGAQRRAVGEIKGKVIAQEATARRVMAQTYANLGDLDDAYDVAEALLSLATDSGYDVADEAQRGFLSRITEPYGFLIDRMTDHNASWAAELLVMAAEALQEIQRDGAKWKREIARTWTGTVLRLTEGLKETERQLLARTLMTEPTLATSVLVETVDKAETTPAWVRSLLDDPAVPGEVRTRLHGTLLLHSRQGHAHSGWPELLRYRVR
ncbi:serine protease [Streptomyces sp. NBC_00264]|uniref:S1 family peptidase n=1 Tax=unclassified Streptomyces TaxID=2593676 RepID=UPI00225076CB|nr:MULTISPECIES: serine protease [unclassified Streptomyces]MCX5163709.1 serine protease [Streptomyces sp. NBC_00305]MCX5222232.1 serine protease [Streptomyces sp. NBC_00264]